MRPEPILKATRSVMLMTTYECQLRCGYCQVRRGPRRMDARTARRGVDFLVASRAGSLLLNFFGGEPLLAWDLVRETALYAQSRRGGRPLRVNLTTNGLLLDDEKLAFLEGFDSSVHLSFDGPRPDNHARLRGAGAGAQAAMEAALRRLASSGVPHHVNVVVDPARASAFDSQLRALEDLGARRIQFGYRVGVLWSPEAVGGLLSALERYEARGRAELINRTSDSEPVMLSREVIVDTDGDLYWDGGLFLEEFLPKAREALRLGSLEEHPSVDALDRQPRLPYERLMAAYPPATPEGHVVLNNIKVGLTLQRHWLDRGRGSTGAEDPAIRRGVVEAGMSEQARFLKEKMPWLDRVFLFLRGGCDLDCIFCRNKPQEGFQSPEEVDAFLAENSALRRKRVALVGNEPMAHPRLAEIVRLCRRRGFADVEVMTSGARLAAQARALADAGVKSYAVALQGSRAEVHDAVTRRAGSLAAVLLGLEAAQAAGARVFVHANACRANLADLPALEALARARGWPFSIHPLRPKDPEGMNTPYHEAAPDYAELRAVLSGRVRSLTGFPACVARDIQAHSSCPGTDVADSMKLYLLHQAFVKPEGCRECRERDRCVGTFEEHLRARPAERAELRCL